jgi:urocanate hydratase
MEAGTLTRPPAPTSTRAVERAVGLLTAVARSAGGGRLSELARATGVPTSTALRLLRTLESQGFVRRDAAGTFHPGAGLLALAAVLDDLPLLEIAEPHLAALAAETGETATLAVRDDRGDAVEIAHLPSPHAIRYAGRRGRRTPGHGTATGAALAGRPCTQTDAAAGLTAIAAPVHGPCGSVIAALCVTGPTFRLGLAVESGAAAEAVRRAAIRLSAELGA